MSVKNFTILLFPVLLAACGRQPNVRTYVETVQLPPPRPAVAAPAMPGDMRAAPLTVEPIPENMPANHPTLTGNNSAPAPGANVMQGRENEVPPALAAGDLSWELPQGWRSLPASGMRLAAFAPESADENTLVTLIILPASAGTLESQIARWREQVALPAENTHAPISLQGKLPYVLVNLVAESAAAELPLSTIGAIYDLPGNRRAYLKFMGKTGQLIDNKGGFLQLAGSLALQEGATP
jgi:hypothetical protein